MAPERVGHVKQPKPRDRREELALFRASVVGALVHRVFERGELKEALRELSQRAFRPPGSAVTRILPPGRPGLARSQRPRRDVMTNLHGASTHRLSFLLLKVLCSHGGNLP